MVALETRVSETRSLAVQAVEAGLLSTVPERSSLLFSKRDLAWPLGNWGVTEPGLEAMMLHVGDRRVDARIVFGTDPLDCSSKGFPPRNCAPLSSRRGWVRIRARRGGGTVILASAIPRGAPRNVADAGQERAASLRVFVVGDAAPPLLVGVRAGHLPWMSDGLWWRRLSRGGDWALFEASPPLREAPLASSVDDPRAQVDFVVPAKPGKIVRIYGTKRLLP